MVNLGIFLKTMRDTAGGLLMALAGMVAFVVLFVWAMLNMGTELLDFVGKFPFIKKIFEMGFGIDVSGEVSINILFAVCFTHAVVLALTWTILISTTTRVIVGEVERGTADLLLTLPVNRSEVYLSTTAVWLIAAALLSFCPLFGIALATWIFQPEEVVEIGRYVAPASNFFCLNLAVGGFSAMLSCILNRRGPTIGITVGVVLVSVILNFLEPFLEWVKSVRFLSLLSYFRPVDVVRTGEWPLQPMAILLLIAGACWTIGLIQFSRKDIPTA